MGAVQDVMSSKAVYTQKMNDVDIAHQRQIQKLKEESEKYNNQMDIKKLELEKRKAESDFALKKAELILQFQTDIKKIEADLMKTRLSSQASLFENFILYMKETLKTNNILIDHKMELYRLSNGDGKRADYFFDEAKKINIFDVEQLINLGHKKIRDLNLESSKEVKYLQSKLEEVLQNIDCPRPQSMIASIGNK